MEVPIANVQVECFSFLTSRITASQYNSPMKTSLIIFFLRLSFYDLNIENFEILLSIYFFWSLRNSPTYSFCSLIVLLSGLFFPSFTIKDCSWCQFLNYTSVISSSKILPIHSFRDIYSKFYRIVNIFTSHNNGKNNNNNNENNEMKNT